jgi:hypothetical protein
MQGGCGRGWSGQGGGRFGAASDGPLTVGDGFGAAGDYPTASPPAVLQTLQWDLSRLSMAWQVWHGRYGVVQGAID